MQLNYYIQISKLHDTLKLKMYHYFFITIWSYNSIQFNKNNYFGKRLYVKLFAIMLDFTSRL